MAITDTTPETTSTGEAEFWDALRGGPLDPAPLAQLAAYMRDGVWLDVRTEDGLLQRVRITEIRVYVHGEDIVLRQEWWSADDYFRHREVIVESEAIWRATPTTVDRHGVIPPVAERPGDPTQVIAAVIAVLVADANVTEPELRGATSVERDDLRRVVLARHSGLILLHQMTDQDNGQITARFGYKSQQPLLTALWKMTAREPNPHEVAFRQATRRRAKMVRDALGYQARTTLRREELV